jgi:pimeloyl-ACP methyl ester carboxylesterase
MTCAEINNAEESNAKINKARELNMRIKKIVFVGMVGLAGLTLSACESDKGTTLQDSLTGSNTVDTISNYDLGAEPPVIPFPNDLLFAPGAGETPDGTLNIPVVDAADLSDPRVAMNGLDGFSTNAPMTTGFTGAINGSSISGDSVRVYPITKGAGPGGPATAVGAPLVFGVDYVAALSSVDSTNSTLAILPLKPLSPKSSYAVVITSKIKGSSGKPMGISGSYALTRGATVLYDLSVPPAVPPSTVEAINDAIKAAVLKPSSGASDEEIIAAGQSAAKLETIRSTIVKPTEDAIIASDSSLTSADIILHWTFSTQSTTDVLAQVRSDVRALTPTAGFGPSGTSSPLGAADINVGSLTVPYYLTAAANTNDPTPLGSFWKGIADSLLTYLAPNPGCLPAGSNVCPIATSTQTIPMMISIPKAIGDCAGGMPGTGWPVVIYQHGITTNRATMLAVSDAMAGACMAVVAIDMPMHGLTGNETNGTEAFKGVPVPERTFDLDLITQDASGSIIDTVPDGVIDSSGIHYINLANLQNTRDNVRQGVSDLFVVVNAIEKGALTDGVNTMDPAKIYFLGHSLGAMVGTVFTALEPGVRDAVFAFGGTSLAKIIDGSATFGPVFAAGLAAQGIIKGTPEYEAFFGTAQTVTDSGDPVNHATAAATGRGVLFFEIVGGNSSPSDLVVPNTVPDGNDTTGTVPAPLAGTEPQLALMGLTQHNSSTSGADLHVVTKYISGSHSSLLDPGPDAAVTTEIQTQAANFFGSDGAALVVTDDTVLQAPPVP